MKTNGTLSIGYCKRPCAECPWRKDVGGPATKARQREFSSQVGILPKIGPLCGARCRKTPSGIPLAIH